MVGTVYLLCDPSNDLYKIGMTKSSVGKRIKELQTGNPTEIHMIKKYDTSIPYFIETSLHHYFVGKQVLNEWYALDAQDIIDFEKHCLRYEEIAEIMKDNPFFKHKRSNIYI